jgi:hypothetical protein
MSPRQIVGDFLARHVVALIVAAFGIGGAYAVLQAQLDDKADRSTVEAMAGDVRAIKVLVCRNYPDDSQCAGAPGVTTRSRSAP